MIGQTDHLRIAAVPLLMDKPFSLGTTARLLPSYVDLTTPSLSPTTVTYVSSSQAFNTSHATTVYLHNL
jgi:hypothetical protein